ncbi:MAG: MerR family transcriptional regulator [Acidobacteria bacterium]|nr:MerR family transcriptional regulator [Acidobacteriota bacterium]MBV9623340.1 MerR family transcriptional regulator [Acidobacteriota bacterium]
MTADAPISVAEAAERIGIGISTLHEWRRKKLFPEPKHHNRGLWFTDNQVSLLEELKEFSGQNATLEYKTGTLETIA